MKVCNIILLAWIYPISITGFVVEQQQTRCTTFVQPSLQSTTQRMNMAQVPLEPEPDGGILMTPRTSVAGCRMKQMNEMTQIKSDLPAYQFWMTGEAQGVLIKEIRTQLLKDASKKANFPGFRKGQVPPYAQPQITQFSIQESIIRTVQAAVDGYGLKSLPGSDGEMKVHEDVTIFAKGYKIGDSIQFTATLNAAYDPEKQIIIPEAESVVVDVDATAVTTDEVVVVDVETTDDNDNTTVEVNVDEEIKEPALAEE